MGQGPLPLEAHRRCQVGLADHHHVGATEGGGVLERLVLSLAHRQQHQPPVLAEVVGGRTDQIAHVLNQQQIEGGQGATASLERLDAAGHHRRIQVAGLTGGDRHRLQTGGPQAGSIVVGGQIPHQGRQGQGAGGAMAGQGLQQGGLTGARRGEDVHHPHPGGVEVAAVDLGLPVVVGQQPQAERLQDRGCDRRGILRSHGGPVERGPLPIAAATGAVQTHQSGSMLASASSCRCYGQAAISDSHSHPSAPGKSGEGTTRLIGGVNVRPVGCNDRGGCTRKCGWREFAYRGTKGDAAIVIDVEIVVNLAKKVDRKWQGEVTG